MALSIIVLAIITLGYLSYHYILHPQLFSPLSKLPRAHPTSSILPTWIWWKRRIGKENRSVFAAHQQNGPVVRLGPNEVSVASLDGLHKIYAADFDRSNFFLQFANFDSTPSLLTFLKGKEHSTRKRLLAPIYSKSYLLGSSDFRTLARVILFDRLLPALDDLARTGEEVDVLELGWITGAEFVTAYGLGIQNGVYLLGETREKERKAYLDNWLAKWKGIHGPEKQMMAAKDSEDELLEMCNKAGEYLALQSSDQSEKAEHSNGKDIKNPVTTYPVVYAQLKTQIPIREKVQDPETLARLIGAEVLDNLEAGREGSGIILAYAMYQLSRHPLLESSLRKELLTLDTPFTNPFSDGEISTALLRQIDNLPLLDAVVTETLRLHAIAPGPQYRIVPKGGVIVDGYFIPEGVVIHTSAFSMHHNSHVFPDANEWKPERWNSDRNDISDYEKDQSNLESGKVENDPRRWFWAFSSGRRMCIGSHFMILVLKLMLASIYTNFTATILTDDKDMQQEEDGVACRPIGGKLISKFNSISTQI